MGFKEMLQQELQMKSEIPEELLSLIPRGYQELDKRVILNLKSDLHPFGEVIGQVILTLFPKYIAVWLRGGWIEGKFREPAGMTHLVGDPSPEVEVHENGIRYLFDFTKIMFAKGNIHERKLLPQKIQKGEIVVDMFTGIGYFTLGIAKTRKPKKVYSIEWNPTAFEYLKKNIILNKVDDIVEPFFGDCKIIANELANRGVEADRIIMGLIPAPVDAIIPALSLVKPSGTVIVYEGVEPRESTVLFDEFSQICEKNLFKSELIERREVKAFKPHEYHFVLEILVKKL